MDGRQIAIKGGGRREATENDYPLTPVSNSVSKRMPIWLGSLSNEEREKRKKLGQKIIPLKNLKPWGKPVNLFAQAQYGEVLAWLETGASEESRRWWKHTYPQLIWEPEGPLSTR